MRGFVLKGERVKRNIRQFEMAILLGFGYPQLLQRIENTFEPVPEEVLRKSQEIFALYDAQRGEKCK